MSSRRCERVGGGSKGKPCAATSTSSDRLECGDLAGHPEDAARDTSSWHTGPQEAAHICEAAGLTGRCKRRGTKWSHLAAPCGCWLGLERALASWKNASESRRPGATAKGIEVGKASMGRCLAPKGWECSKSWCHLGSSKGVSTYVSQQVGTGFLDRGVGRWLGAPGLGRPRLRLTDRLARCGGSSGKRWHGIP